MALHTLHPTMFERVGNDAFLSRVLAPICYTDPCAFEIEKREVFAKSWLYAGHESQIATPGDRMPVRVGGQPVVVLRDRESCVRRGMTMVDRAGM